MGLGSTAKTLQRVADMGEEVYSRLNEVRAQLKQLRDTVEETNEHVASLESEIAEQRAILDALAEKQGVDVESVTAEIHIEEAEQAATDEVSQSDQRSPDDQNAQNAEESTDDRSEDPGTERTTSADGEGRTDDQADST